MTRHKKKKPKQPVNKAKPDFSNKPLAGLKELTRQATARKTEAIRPVVEDAIQDPDSATGEDVLFTRAMADVAPMGGRTASLPPEPRRPPPPPLEDREAEEVMQALTDLVSGESGFSIHQTEEAIEGLAPGVDTRLLRKLKRGEFSVQDHLDLHGQTREEARQTVALFLQQAVASGKRCVLIIHGRGHGSKDKVPVLKTAIQSWFVRSGIRKLILAFCTARACDGGAGALYVLLRKRLPMS